MLLRLRAIAVSFGRPDPHYHLDGMLTRRDEFYVCLRQVFLPIESLRLDH
jgi:hypothetical protein